MDATRTSRTGAYVTQMVVVPTQFADDIRWLEETSDKATHEEDKRKLVWLHALRGERMLDEINLDVIDSIRAAKLKEASEGKAISLREVETRVPKEILGSIRKVFDLITEAKEKLGVS